jgi:organic radical activating enzyme
LLGDVDWYCFSPKKFKTPCAEAFERANELKVIINHVSDLDWADQQAEKLNKKALKYLQPEWSKQERMLPQIIERVKKNPSWKISLQTHKFMNIP